MRLLLPQALNKNLFIEPLNELTVAFYVISFVAGRSLKGALSWLGLPECPAG